MTDKPMQVDSEVLELAYKKALLYAARKLSSYHKSGLLSRLDAYDVTNEAVEKTLSGVRPWNRAKNPDLFVHLAGCISSMINNAYTSADFQLVERSEHSESIIEIENKTFHEANEVLEFQSKIEFLLDYLVTLRKDIKHVATVMIKDGVTEPKEIAKELNMTIAEVNAKKLAIKRMLLRTDFLLHYITCNREDLVSLALAIYRDKISDAETLSKTLKISTCDVRKKRSELYNIVEDIYRGVI